jgi:hypothetical protein
MQQTPPRLPVPPATDRTAWDPARLDAVTLRDRGRQDLGSPWLALLAHAYARYVRGKPACRPAGVTVRGLNDPLIRRSGAVG